MGFLLSFIFFGVLELNFENSDINDRLAQKFSYYKDFTGAEKQSFCDRGDSFSCVLLFLEAISDDSGTKNDDLIDKIKKYKFQNEHKDIASYIFISKRWNTVDSDKLSSLMADMKDPYKTRVYPLYLKKLAIEGKIELFVKEFKPVADEEVSFRYFSEILAKEPVNAFDFIMGLQYEFSETFYEKVREKLESNLGKIRTKEREKEYIVWQMLNNFKNVHYEKCIKLGKSLYRKNEISNIYEWRANLLKAMSLTKRREHEKAVPIYELLDKFMNEYELSDAEVNNLYALGGFSYATADDNDAAFEFYMKGAQYFKDKKNAAELLYKAAEIARISENFAKAEEFFKILVENYPQSENSETARFLLFWINYKQKKYEKALELIDDIVQSKFGSSYTVMRAKYWHARIEEKIGRDSEAVRIYSEIVNEGPVSFYGTLSASRLKLKGIDMPIKPPAEEEDISLYSTSNLLPETMWIMALMVNSNDTMLRSALLLMKGKIIDKGSKNDRLYTAYAAKEAGFMPLSATILKTIPSLSENTKEYIKLQYQTAYEEEIILHSDFYGVSPLFVFSIARQESLFDVRAVSKANAIGLLQLMPATAQMLATQEDYGKINVDQLKRPLTNARFGIKFLSNLIARYHGSLSLAAAAYNAGPGRVDGWLVKNSKRELDELIEDIPIFETRNYVKRVMNNYAVYYYLYKNEIYNGINFDLN